MGVIRYLIWHGICDDIPDAVPVVPDPQHLRSVDLVFAVLARLAHSRHAVCHSSHE
ncbi:MAG: hypothetical protein GY814_20460 [Gammaproteobacteria bacterium]|nr:hypothetical protein [Gammaproteobacteria bacterium]